MHFRGRTDRYRWWRTGSVATLAIMAIGLVVRADEPPPGAGKPGASAAEEEFFEAKVRPVLAEHCLRCHGVEKSKGGLRLDARASMLKGGDGGPAVVPGQPEKSALVDAVRYDGEIQMPPNGKLKDAEIAALTDWVRRGAHWPSPRPMNVADRSAPAAKAASAPSIAASAANEQARAFWSFRPVGDPVPPAVRRGDWASSPIDRFVLARLEAEGLEPSPAADRRALIRRVSFDLIGLPPTPEEVDAFVRDDSPRAYERLVDRLLASPHYGERQARFWMDIARYGEDQAHSFQPRLYPYGYRYRDWLIAAFNRDVPYDQFVIEQIAGDLVDGPASERLDRLAALGFFACGPVYYGDAKQLDQYADRIDTLSRGFLGLTVACARCHDHKYDPIPTTDYYALEGIFASTNYVEVPAVAAEVVAAYDRAQAAIKDQEKAIATFLRDEAKRQGDKQKLANDNQLRAFEKKLSGDARAKVKVMRAELDRLKKSAPEKYPVIHALVDASQPKDMPVLARGNPSAPGAKVPRRFLTVLGGDRGAFPKGSGRLELARAIASPDNPLTARVMVNRVWQHHFGRGLVGTASNFGTLGERPSHPELLDWLARRFIESGWSIKTLHREIVLSSTYRQSSRENARGYSRDPGNVLLWRMNRKRLEVESWRDAMLAVAGRLDEAMGGPSVGIDAPGNRRRTAYAAVSRHDLAWMLRLFDFPDPNITSGGRVETTVPLQQLFVLNSELMTTAARSVADRLRREEPASDEAARIRRAYRLLYNREASPRELEIGRAYLRAADRPESPESASVSASASAAAGPARPDLSRWERYTHALLAANEFLFVD
ncbi:MAG: PSD1 and planctomycete cytochrome C domain-containing protein [Isosphaeraceae bacterium]